MPNNDFDIEVAYDTRRRMATRITKLEFAVADLVARIYALESEKAVTDDGIPSPVHRGTSDA